MKSELVILPVAKLQRIVASKVKTCARCPVLYVALNKNVLNTKKVLKAHGINISNLYFIDCVDMKETCADVLHVAPDRLDLLSTAIRFFLSQLPGEKYLIIDALATLLVYNKEPMVVKFVKEITNYGSKHPVHTAAFSPQTNKQELVTKIFNYFDEVHQ